MPAIQIDPASGLKRFDTRAAKASERIAGKGYSVIADEALTTLPELPAGATFNAEEQARYRAFKEARRGAADYIPLEGEFAKYLADVYSAEPVAREPLTDRFSEFPYRAAGGGAPQLLAAPVFIDCAVTDIHAAGDHLIAVGQGLRVDHASTAAPLLYHRGQYPKLTPG